MFRIYKLNIESFIFNLRRDERKVVVHTVIKCNINDDKLQQKLRLMANDSNKL